MSGNKDRAARLRFVAVLLPLALSASVYAQQPGAGESPFPVGESPESGPGLSYGEPSPNAPAMTARRAVSNCTDEGKRYEFIREGQLMANVTVPANSRSPAFSAPAGLYDIRIYNASGYLRTFNYTMSASSTGIHSGCAEESLRINPTHGIKQAGGIVNRCSHDVRIAFWRGARAPQKSQKVYDVVVPARSSVSKVLLSGTYTVATSSGNVPNFVVKPQQQWTYEPACIASHRHGHQARRGDGYR